MGFSGLSVTHLGWSGLRLSTDLVEIEVDPPEEGLLPRVATWSEAERLRGARGGPLAADAAVLRRYRLSGVALAPEFRLGGLGFRAAPFRPIPWATAEEAVRKVRSGLGAPWLAFDRLRHTLGRPPDPPWALSVTLPSRGGEFRVALLGQSAHRFVSPAEFQQLAAELGPVDVVIAGTDYDDEEATGRLIGLYPARAYIIADLTGEIRRKLGLPTRDLACCLRAAPRDAQLLHPGRRLSPRQS